MSNSIAHLAVARGLLACLPGLVENETAYYLGTLAPDTISSRPGCGRQDKKRVHLREDIPDVDWLKPEQMKIFRDRIEAFARQYIRSESGTQRDFNIGFLVHLLTDKWNHKTVRQTMLRIAHANGVQETDREFYHMMVNDLEALDQYLLEKSPEIGVLFEWLTGGEVEYSLPGYIEREYIAGSMLWWKTQYIPGIRQRKLLYIGREDIDEFVDTAVAEIAGEVKLLTEA